MAARKDHSNPDPPKIGKARTRHLKPKPEKVYKNKPGGGRPSKYTPKLGKDICEALRLGVTVATAAASVMITSETVENWINAGLRGDSEELAEFAAWVDQARANFILDNLKNLQQCAKGTKDRPPQWLPSAWQLERMVPGQPYAIQRHKLEIQDTTVRDVAITQAQSLAIEDRLAQCPIHHEVIEVEYSEVEPQENSSVDPPRGSSTEDGP